jgi:hypothetical protein
LKESINPAQGLYKMFHRLKYILKSKDLFQNWLSAGIKFYLIEKGLIKDDIVIKCDNNVFILDPKVYLFIVSTYYSGYLKAVSCDDILKGRLWDTIDFVILKDGEGFLRCLMMLCFLSNLLILLLFLRFGFMTSVFSYLFSLTDWFVMSINAFVSDTALY